VRRNAIIVGGGRVGCHTAEQLLDHDYTVTVIERDADMCQELSTQQVGQIIEGDGTDSETLQQADAATADVVAALTDNTQANVTVCELARDLAPDVRTLARVARDGEQEYQHRSAIDNIVYPAAAGADIAVDRLLRD
jgi:trk system potassium uptake protein TrkA